MTIERYIQRRIKELSPPYLAEFEMRIYQQRIAELKRLQEALKDGTIKTDKLGLFAESGVERLCGKR